jgi:hypothetical protein
LHSPSLDQVNVGAGGVRDVWLRHDIETRHKRPAAARENTIRVSDEQLRLLQRPSSDFPSRHTWRASRPGELLNQDTFYWGCLRRGSPAASRHQVQAVTLHLSRTEVRAICDIRDGPAADRDDGEETRVAGVHGAGKAVRKVEGFTHLLTYT